MDSPRRVRKSGLGAALLVLAALPAVAGCQLLYDSLGGNFTHRPEDFEGKAPKSARMLAGTARKGLVGGVVVDHHVHIAGRGRPFTTAVTEICGQFSNPDGSNDPDVWINPDYLLGRFPELSLQMEIMFDAAAVSDQQDADTQYVTRLAELARHTGLNATYLIYAMDYRYDGPVGRAVPDLARSDLFVGNAYVVWLAGCLQALARDRGTGSYTARFQPVASIHPYKDGAVAELRAIAGQVRYLKWLPPAQNTDPADSRLDPFYKAMRDCGIVLLSHTGNEHTFRAGNQDLGNPLRLARALDNGVTVVMLHSGRKGRDFRSSLSWSTADDADEKGWGPEYYELFQRMMANPRYEGRLFGEIAAVPYLGSHPVLAELLKDESLTGRLLDGSDYPNPALNLVRFSAEQLDDAYFQWDEDGDDLTLAQQRKVDLKVIYGYNPLLYDFVLKRTLRFPIATVDQEGRPVTERRALPLSLFQGIDNLPQRDAKRCPTAGKPPPTVESGGRG